MGPDVMLKRAISASLLTLLFHVALAHGHDGADSTQCRAMAGRIFGPARIVAATFTRPPQVTEWQGGRESATVTTAYCRLEGEITKGGGHSRFEVWLPIRTKWNGRLLGVGAGGPYGYINTVHLAAGVNRGFASVATDNGHRSPSRTDDLQWAFEAPDRVADFGYLAHHRATIAAKTIIAAYYRRAAEKSYFYGCSQGGQKGLAAAQFFPADYDGIAAGAPVYSWANEAVVQLWGVRAVTETERSALTVANLQALQAAVAQRCSAANGIVMAPHACSFEPADLQCGSGNADACLNAEQVTAVRKIYDGPRTSTGDQIWPGFERGSERLWEQFFTSARADGTRGGGSGFGIFRYIVKADPSWTLSRLDFDRDPEQARRKLPATWNPDSPNLDKFAARGGKLLVYHGWADQQVPPKTSLAYHREVVARSGRKRTDTMFRLFMVPGMAHCVTESPGPNLLLQPENDPAQPVTPERDALAALQQWVEQNEPPSRFVVRISDERRSLSTRSVLTCAQPQAPQYKGDGDPLDVKNWQCAQQ